MAKRKVPIAKEVLCCILVFVILMSVVPSSAFAMRDNNSLSGKTIRLANTEVKAASILEIKFTGTAVERCGVVAGADYWVVNVEELISGPPWSGKLTVYTINIFADSPIWGYADPDISVGDKVEVYGKCVSSWGGKSVTLNGREDYYIKKTDVTAKCGKITNWKTACTNVQLGGKFGAEMDFDNLMAGGYRFKGIARVRSPTDEVYSGENQPRFVSSSPNNHGKFAGGNTLYVTIPEGASAGNYDMKLELWNDDTNTLCDDTGWKENIFTVKDGGAVSEIVFIGTAIEGHEASGMPGEASYWIVSVDKLISGPQPCSNQIKVITGQAIGPLPWGYVDPSIKESDKVKVYGKYDENLYGSDECAVWLYESEDYYIKKSSSCGSIKITRVSPQPGTTLNAGDTVTFTVNVDYDLEESDYGKIRLSVNQYTTGITDKEYSIGTFEPHSGSYTFNHTETIGDDWENVYVSVSLYAAKQGKPLPAEYTDFDYKQYPVEGGGDCFETVPSDHWKGEYYNNKNLAGSSSMVRDGGTGYLNFDWDVSSPSTACGIGSDFFSVRWTRSLNFDSGTWHFTATTDDGMRVYVDGSLVIDKWFNQVATTYIADVDLTAGTHTIKVEYYEYDLTAVAKLSWEKGDGKEIKFTGTATDYWVSGGQIHHWTVLVDEVTRGPQPCEDQVDITVYDSEVPSPWWGYVDPNLNIGDRVEVYGRYYDGHCSAMHLHGSTEYYIKEILKKLPDLTFSSYDISFSNPSPAVGERVTITATIYNTGIADANDVIVQFFDGYPNNGGTQIGDDQTIASINAGGSGVVSVERTAEAGTHDIYVVVDPPIVSGGSISESDEDNNIAFLRLSVTPKKPDYIVTDIKFFDSPVIYKETTIEISLANIGGSEPEEGWKDLTVNVYDGHPSHDVNLIGTKVVPSAFTSLSFTLPWTPRLAGDQYVWAEVDATDTMSEDNEGNNIWEEIVTVETAYIKLEQTQKPYDQAIEVKPSISKGRNPLTVDMYIKNRKSIFYEVHIEDPDGTKVGCYNCPDDPSDCFNCRFIQPKTVFTREPLHIPFVTPNYEVTFDHPRCCLMSIHVSRDTMLARYANTIDAIIAGALGCHINDIVVNKLFKLMGGVKGVTGKRFIEGDMVGAASEIGKFIETRDNCALIADALTETGISETVNVDELLAYGKALSLAGKLWIVSQILWDTYTAPIADSVFVWAKPTNEGYISILSVEDTNPDNAPPIITLTSPKNGDLSATTVTISGTIVNMSDKPLSAYIIVDGLVVNQLILDELGVFNQSIEVSADVHVITVRANNTDLSIDNRAEVSAAILAGIKPLAPFFSYTGTIPDEVFLEDEIKLLAKLVGDFKGYVNATINNTTVPLIYNSTSSLYENIIYAPSINGTYTLEVMAINSAGDIIAYNKYTTITVKNPVLTIAAASSNKVMYKLNEEVRISCLVKDGKGDNIPSATTYAVIKDPDGHRYQISLAVESDGFYYGLFKNTSIVGAYSAGIYSNKAGYANTTALLSFDVFNYQPIVSIISPTNGAVYKIGDNITFKGSALDSDGNILSFNWTSSIDEVLRLNSNPICVERCCNDSFNLSNLSVGKHIITLNVKSDDGLECNSRIALIIKKVENQPPLNPILKPDKPEPQPAGTAITWTAAATDPDGDTLYYRFWLKGPATGNSWTIMQDWSTDNTWMWYTNSADVGDTVISVWIRDGNHAPPERYDVEKIYYDYQIASGTVGAISVTSEPYGASIGLETPVGMFLGPTVKTPYTITNVPVGTSTITLSLNGYQDWSTKVMVRAGEATYVDATLTPISGHPLNSVHEKITNNEVDDSDPTIVQISNGDILVAYTNWLNGAQIYLTRSSDNGLTWSTPVAITNQYHNIDPYITPTSDGKVWIVWTGSWVPGDFDNYYVTSDDNGQTWSEIKHIPTPEDWGTHTTIAEDSNHNVWIMWGDHYVISDDFGEQWSQINQMPSWNGNNPFLFCDANGRLWIVTWSIVIPEITQFVDGTIWITYHSNINGNREVYYTSSSDNGNTWSNPKQITDNSSQDWMPAIASINDVEIWVTWDSNRDGDRDIYLTKFLIIC
jgi:hypothetical protein